MTGSESDLPPPRDAGALNEFAMWMRERPSRQWLVLGAGLVVILPLVMAAWIGLAFVMYEPDSDSADAALNIVLVGVVTLIGVPLMHRAMYRWLWHIDRRRRRHANLPEPRYGSKPTAPPPHIRWTVRLRFRHAMLYVLGMTTLLWSFLPYRHQSAANRFIAEHSGGSASARSLNGILFVYLPMAGMLLIVMLLTYRGMQRRNAGLLTPDEQLLLSAELNWLMSLAYALSVAIMLSRLIGGMIAAYL
jgi:hypothetical protein